jgi:hypothetical protein
LQAPSPAIPFIPASGSRSSTRTSRSSAARSARSTRPSSTATASGTWQAPSEDAFGNTRAHLQLEAVVDRTVFGLNWNMDLPTGGKALGNDVTLTVDLALVQQG